VPKVLGLLLVAAAVAVTAGLALPAAALKVGSTTLSQASFANELAAMKTSSMFQCYLEARVFLASQGQSQGPTFGGASTQSRSSLAAALWADQRVTQLAVTAFVQARNPGAFSQVSLKTARVALEETIVRTLGDAFNPPTSTPTSFSCTAVVIPGNPARLDSGATILATLPVWFQDDQVRAEAADLGLIDLLPGSIKVPESGPGLRRWFARHASQFETTCVGDIEVLTPSAASTIKSKIAHGLSFAAAARRYSKDTSTNKKGGRIGCFSPNSAVWSQVVHYVGSTATGKIATWPISSAYILYSPTSRTPNSFSKVATAVEIQVHQANVQNAAIFGAHIQQATPVSVGSWLGAWELNGIGGQVIPNLAVPNGAVTNPTANTPIG
jgi:hypothetical protein